MNRYNGIAICPTRSLEVGDMFSTECVGTVFGGKLIERIYDSFDVKTQEARDYLEQKGLDLPDTGSGSHTLLLIVEQRVDGEKRLNHIFLDFDWNVVVFANSLKKEG